MHLRALFIAGALASSAAAQEPDLQAGQDLFMSHCWQCHGLDAKGDGPMAEMLAIVTPDLTGLASRNAGVFPLEDVARQIDGRDALLAHGGVMPIFGPFLESDQGVVIQLPSGQPMMTGVPLASVIMYLEALQTP